MQETRAPSLIWEDPACHRATKPMLHSYWACGLESRSRNFWAMLQLRKPKHPRAGALQPEKLLQQEAHAPQPVTSPRSLQLEKKPGLQRRSA